MNANGFYIFVLMLALILVAYYVGASTDFAAFAKGSQQLIYALTGRDSSGKFANYPSGATIPAGVVG